MPKNSIPARVFFKDLSLLISAAILMKLTSVPSLGVNPVWLLLRSFEVIDLSSFLTNYSIILRIGGKSCNGSDFVNLLNAAFILV